MAKVIKPDYPRFADFPDFLPDLSPAAMLAAGVFDGGYFFKGSENDLKGIDPSILSAGPYKENPDAGFNYFETSSGQSLSIWHKNGWIHNQDPLGWFHFYCRFYSGRRSEDDKRQITRWVDYKRRWTPKSKEAAQRQAITPKGRQALLHWGIDPFPSNQPKGIHMNRIIPLAITEKAFRANPGMIMGGDFPILGKQDDYEPRPAIDLSEEQASMSPEDIAEIAWMTYQNIDENRRSPDGGRSMMMGDIVRVELEGKPPVWLTVAVMGFKDVSEHMKDWII